MKLTNKIYGAVSALLVVGIFMGGYFFGKESINSSEYVALANKALPDYVDGEVEEADFRVFWDVWKLIDDKYPNSTEIESQERV
jgi:hypothetical protein